MTSYYTALQTARDAVNLPIQPQMAIIIGSGLQGILAGAQLIQRIPFSDIEGWPVSTAPGHLAEIRLLVMNDIPVLAFCGRVHLYEGYTARDVVKPVYLSYLLGIQNLLITNAAGALNENLAVGEVVLLSDHINHTGHNPLTGVNDNRLGPRFIDMSQPYSPRLCEAWLQAAATAGQTVSCGIYAGITGPSLETSAERRMLRTMGADLVGMSTVLEVIAANHCGLQTLALSAVTNQATGINQQLDTIESVLAAAGTAATAMGDVLPGFLSAITA